MEQESWISRTGQLWKVHVFVGLLLITLISFGGVLWKTNESVGSLIFGLSTIEMTLIFLGLAGLTFTGCGLLSAVQSVSRELENGLCDIAQSILVLLI